MLTMEQIRDEVKKSNYDFLREDTHLKGKIALLGIGGSYAYGTANDNSDIDIRGIAFNSPSEILRGVDFEQVEDKETDTVIYSFKKIINLLLNNNPNTIEILGLSDNQYVYKNDKFVQELNWLKSSFLSRKVIRSFAGYCSIQLRRLSSKAASQLSDRQREEYILRSINFAQEDFTKNIRDIDKDGFKLYVDDTDRDGMTHEIYIDVDLKHYPLRDFNTYIRGFTHVVNDYDKIGDSRRNRRARIRGMISKHMMHLIRLYYMAFDILEYQKIQTYREKERDFLLRIRNGEFIDSEEQPTKEFLDMVDGLEIKMKELSKTTKLPQEPDYDKIYSWVDSVNRRIVLGEW